MSILLFAEHNNAVLKAETNKLVNAVSKLDDEIHLLVAGHECKSVAEQATKIDGVSKVLHVDDAVYANQLAENIADLVLELSGGYSVIAAPSTTTGKNFMPRVAVLLDVAQLSDVIEIIDAETFARPIYAGNAIATVHSTDTTKVLTVRTSAFDANENNNNAVIEPLSIIKTTELTSFISEELSKSERPELTASKVVISGGRGMKNGENFALLDGVANKLDAAIGASRAAVDAGFVSNDMQVGQTGKIVAPQLYIAVGISGAIQHIAGMKDSKVIVAINNDEEAPIFQVADYGLVGDLFEVIPALEEAL